MDESDGKSELPESELKGFEPPKFEKLSAETSRFGMKDRATALPALAILANADNPDPNKPVKKARACRFVFLVVAESALGSDESALIVLPELGAFVVDTAGA